MDWLKELLRKFLSWFEDNSDLSTNLQPNECEECRGTYEKPVEIKLTDFQILVLKESELCPTCAKQYVKKVSTPCFRCQRYIFPNEPVFTNIINGDLLPEHLYCNNCTDSGAEWCGYWGDGKIITLHDLMPEKYPVEATNVMSLSLITLDVVIENTP